MDDLFHDFNAGEVWDTDPDNINRRVSHHLGYGFVSLGFANIELPDKGYSRFGCLLIKVDYAQNIRIPNANPGADVELGDKASTDNPYTQSLLRHFLTLLA
jgi:hypothetical protein